MFRIITQDRTSLDVRCVARFGSLLEAVTVTAGLRGDNPGEFYEVRHPNGRLVTRGEAMAALGVREAA